MYDYQRIGIIISDIERYLSEIEGYGIKSVEDMKISQKKHATSMLIFAILNRLSDIGDEIIRSENLGAPTRYTDIMPTLAKAGIINKEQAEKVNKLMEKRNIIAHFYGDIEPKDVFLLVEKLPIIKQFLATIKKRVKK